MFIRFPKYCRAPLTNSKVFSQHKINSESAVTYQTRSTQNFAQFFWWEISQLYHSGCRVSLLLTLALSFASDSCNNKDILFLL